MQTILLQPWTSVASALTFAFTQQADQWVDLACYSDIAGFWIDVSGTQGMTGTDVQLTLQSSPSHDEAYFQPLLPPIPLVASPTPTFVKAVRMASTSSLGRWARWQLSGTPSSVSGLWGATFRVRAVASKQQSFSPLDIPGCVLWLRSDVGVTTAGTTTLTVSEWADQSGAGYNVSQGTSGDQPGYTAPSAPILTPYVPYQPVPNITFGANAVLLDNTSSNLLASGQARTVLMACQSTNATGGALCTFRRSTAGSTTICCLSFLTGAGIADIYTDGIVVNNIATISTSAVPEDQIMILDWELAQGAGNIAFALNGASQTVSQVSNVGLVPETSTAAGQTVGAREDVSQPWPGNIYELLVYSGVLTATQLGYLRNYLGGRYGVVIT
jgi:hypothetical protein